MFGYYPRRDAYFSSPYVDPYESYRQQALAQQAARQRQELARQQHLRALAAQRERELERERERARYQAYLDSISGRPRQVPRASPYYRASPVYDEEEDEDYYYSPYGRLAPRQQRQASGVKFAPQSRPASIPVSSPAPQSSDTASAPIKIKIRSPSPTPAPASSSKPSSAPSFPQPSTTPLPSGPELEALNKAAETIQSTWRTHHYRTAAHNALTSLLQRFRSLHDELRPQFPSSPEFLPDASPSSFKLAYTPVNRPVHAYEHGATKILEEIDGVESHGDAGVRAERRKIVREIEEKLKEIEEWKRGAWEETHTAKDSEEVKDVTMEAVEEEQSQAKETAAKEEEEPKAELMEELKSPEEPVLVQLPVVEEDAAWEHVERPDDKSPAPTESQLNLQPRMFLDSNSL